MMNIGAILKYYRALYGLTQSEVAYMSGINEKYLGRIERNESVPTVDKIEQLCLAFDVRIADLLTPSVMLSGLPNKSSFPEHGKLKTIYYCNCCGEEFSSDSEEIICPNCSCIYDVENGYIEKYTSFLSNES